MQHHGGKTVSALRERLFQVFHRLNVPVVAVRIEGQQVIVDLANGADGIAATIFMVPTLSHGEYYRVVGQYGFYYQGQVASNPALVAQIDLVVTVLSTIAVPCMRRVAQVGVQTSASRSTSASVVPSIKSDGYKPVEAVPNESAERVVPVTARSLANLSRLVPDVVASAMKLKEARLVLELLSPEDVTPPDEPVSFSALFEAMPLAFRVHWSRAVKIRTRVGGPACLMPDIAEKVAGSASMEEGFRTPAVTVEPCRSCGANSRCGGVSSSYVARFGTGELRPFPTSGTWRDRARWLLTGRPEIRIPVGHLVPADELPKIRCTRPWTRLEMHENGGYGPCGGDYINGPHFMPAGASLMDLWHSDLLRSFRKQMIESDHPQLCRSTCPVLLGCLESPSRLILRGGPAPMVENQLRLVQGLIDRRVEPDWLPTSICIPVTSFCNYNCLMCACGETGTLSDQKTLSSGKDWPPFSQLELSLMLMMANRSPLLRFGHGFARCASTGGYRRLELLLTGHS